MLSSPQKAWGDMEHPIWWQGEIRRLGFAPNEQPKDCVPHPCRAPSARVGRTDLSVNSRASHPSQEREGWGTRFHCSLNLPQASLLLLMNNPKTGCPTLAGKGGKNGSLGN